MRSGWVHGVGAIILALLAVGARLAKTAAHDGEIAAKFMGREAMDFEKAGVAAGREMPRFVMPEIPNVRIPNLSNLESAGIITERPRPGSSEVFLIGPKNDEEARNIFGKGLRQGELDNIFAETRLGAKRADKSSQLTDAVLTSRIRSSDDTYIIVIGHNDGGMLKFPDGSGIPLSDLSATCNSAGKVCIFLSCNSAKFTTGQNAGVGIELSYRDAIDISDNLTRLIKRNKKRSTSLMMKDVHVMLRGSEFSVAVADAAGVTKPLAVAGGGYGLYSVYSSRR